MARNQEKAQSLLNRWTAHKQELRFGPQKKRPTFSSDCKSISEAERWRRNILKDMAQKIAVIQDAGLGEHRLRELNDEINKLLREKARWEKQIKALGGRSYSLSAPKAYDADGRELPGSGGYKYFGAAKDLPGVRELFEPTQKSKDELKRTRKEIYQHVDAAYFGFGDHHDDHALVLVEAEMERRKRAKAAAEWTMEKSEEIAPTDAKNKSAPAKAPKSPVEDSSDEDEFPHLLGLKAAAAVKAPSAQAVVADEKEIEQQILEKKKQALLAKYGG